MGKADELRIKREAKALELERKAASAAKAAKRSKLPEVPRAKVAAPARKVAPKKPARAAKEGPSDREVKGGRIGGRSSATPPPVKRGRPRAGDRGETLAVTKPWEAHGISQATYYRRLKTGEIKR